jgi:hypothetical protein
MKPAQPAVQGHRLGRQAANAAEMFDDGAERGHDANGVVVQLDWARQVRHAGLHGDLRWINREGKRSRNRVVGFLLHGMAEHQMVLLHWSTGAAAESELRCCRSKT